MPKSISLEPIPLYAGRYLTKQQVAARCGVSPDTVQYWLVHKDLPAIRIGTRGYLVTEADLERFTPPRGGRSRDHSSAPAHAAPETTP